MKNFRLVLEYDGSKYHGWQRQTVRGSTVQGRIEYVLGQMSGKEVELIGAGRTDAGVHALGQVANFKIEGEHTLKSVKDYLEKYLPEDIRLVTAEEALPDFHARYNAKGKHYRYQIWNSPDKTIFERGIHFLVREKLNLKAMQEAAAHFIGEKDFHNFSSVHSKKKSSVRTLHSIEISDQTPRVYITFKGDGFLHNMVRIITGTLIQAGLGEIKPSSVPAMFTGSSRQSAGFTAPPHGLFLVEVYF